MAKVVRQASEEATSFCRVNGILSDEEKREVRELLVRISRVRLMEKKKIGRPSVNLCILSKRHTQ